MKMVSEKKRTMLHDVEANIEKYPVIGVLDMKNLPARQLFMIKQQLRGKAVIRMAKKNVIRIALEQSKKPGIQDLRERIQNQPALLFSYANPFELARTISKSVSKAKIKKGEIAPKDIIIPAGPTSLPPGPAIGELQRLKMPVGVEGDKIAVKKDTRVAKAGEKVTAEVADVLSKLGIEPNEISLNLIAVWDNGTVFDRDILFISVEQYIEQIKSAYFNALNLAINTSYMTRETLPLLLSKAHQQAVSLALKAKIRAGAPDDLGKKTAHEAGKDNTGG